MLHSGGGGEGIQRPVVGFLVLIRSGLQLATGTADQPPGRICSYPSEMIQERSASVRAGLASGTRAVAESVYPLRASKRWIRSRTGSLRMASQLGSDFCVVPRALQLSTIMRARTIQSAGA